MEERKGADVYRCVIRRVHYPMTLCRSWAGVLLPIGMSLGDAGCKGAYDGSAQRRPGTHLAKGPSFPNLNSVILDLARVPRSVRFDGLHAYRPVWKLPPCRLPHLLRSRGINLNRHAPRVTGSHQPTKYDGALARCSTSLSRCRLRASHIKPLGHTALSTHGFNDSGRVPIDFYSP